MFDVPFDLHPEAAARWLAELESVPIKTRSRHLYAALKALNATALPETARLALLEVLRPWVVAASEILARNFVRFHAPQSDTARKTAKLSALLHHELAAGYERVLAEATLVAGHRILVSLGWMLVRILQLGEPLGSSVWKRLYAIYQQGETAKWLTQPVDEPLAAGLTEPPKDRFKCAVMFVALASMRLDPHLMSELFLYLLQHRQSIELSELPTVDGWFIDLSQATGPRRVGLDLGIPGRLLYLKIHLPQTERPPSPLLQRLQYCLGQPPAEEYPLTRRVDEVWCGRESILAELKRRRSQSVSSNAWLRVPEFELTPLDNDSSTSTSRVYRRLDALLRMRQDNPITVLEMENINIQPGDLIVLELLDETLLAAVVRWVQTSVWGNKTKLGLEPFKGGVECVQALIVGQGPAHALAITDPLQENLVLALAPIRLKLGTKIMIGDSEAQVIRLLEWTDDFYAYCLEPL